MKIKHVAWRDGRPRFNPPENLRKAGHKGHDLKVDGRWMTRGEAVDWSENFDRLLKAERDKAKATKEKLRLAEERARKVAAAAVPKLPARARSLTMGQLLERFVAARKGDIAEATLNLYQSARRTLEAEAPMAYATEAADITQRAVQGMYDAIRRKRGVAMAYLTIRSLSIAYNWANRPRQGFDLKNPTRGIEMEKPKPRVRSIGVAEFLHLVETADAIGCPEIGDMITFGVFTCQRASDRLKMAKIDIVSGRVSVWQQKTNAHVVVKLARPIADRMKARPSPSAATVIAEAWSERPLNYRMYNRRFRKVRSKAAETMPSIADFRDQDLRDTGITWLLRAGCTEAQAMSITGHQYSGNHSILSHYADIDYTMADEAVAKVERWFARELKKLKQEKPK